MKTEHQLHRKMCTITVYLAITLLVVIAIVSLWTPLTHMQILHNAGLVYLIYIFITCSVARIWLVLGGIVRSAYNYGHYQPFLLLSLFIGTYWFWQD